ncbi:MAG: tail fiber domain-containing protein [Nitrospirae bacterium]|uniref:tail fiber domain-containing protein n=1 Tax=Candidatus Magnetobacterium casense TaxID=1455061 RepID=UPI00138DEA24|nr:tail fiber domain-containing protein [Candidatus Magnetobacterium casensis]MBF0338968.1 tail fiber domain-containing protein [Nitrospirota bacterium]
MDKIRNGILIYVQEAIGGTIPAKVIAIANNGNLGIGTMTPSYPIHMGSGAYVTTGGVWTNASSREYKKDIQSLTSEDAMLAFNKLEPVSFKYKTDDEHHIGFIAEDVPDIVATQDRKGLSPMDMVAILTKVVQEQQKTIAELSDRVKSLEHQTK